MKKKIQFNFFVENLIKSYKLKKISVVQQDFFGLENILSEMYFVGIICGYHKISKNFFEILLKYSAYGKPLFFEYKNYYTKSRKQTITTDKLKSINFIEPFSHSFVLTANHGISLQKNALLTRTGGFFLTKIK